MTLTRDDFEEWLAQMDDRIYSLKARLPSDITSQLDYSAPSLDVLEGWLLAQYPSTRALLTDQAKEALDQIASYVGEVFRKNIGGVWTIDLDDPKNAYFQMPVLEERGKWVLCPITLTTACADRRTGQFLSRILHNRQADKGKRKGDSVP